MIYKGKNFGLREVSMADAGDLFKISQQKDVMKFYGVEPYTNVEEAFEEIEWFQSLKPTGSGFRWAIVDEQDRFIGSVGVFGYDALHNRIDLGYQLAKPYWGMGIMSTSIAKVLEVCFHEKHFNRIQAVVDPRNKASARVLLKNGFTREGRLRQYEFERGKYIDVDMYSILSCEYSVKN